MGYQQIHSSHTKGYTMPEETEYEFSLPSLSMAGKGYQNTLKKPMVKSETDTSGFGNNAGTYLQGAKAIADIWVGYQGYKAQKEQNKLARESFEFNKDLSTKNFDLAKADYDRKVTRSNNISNEWAEANRAQAERNKKAKEL